MIVGHTILKRKKKLMKEKKNWTVDNWFVEQKRNLATFHPDQSKEGPGNSVSEV